MLSLNWRHIAPSDFAEGWQEAIAYPGAVGLQLGGDVAEEVVVGELALLPKVGRYLGDSDRRPPTTCLDL